MANKYFQKLINSMRDAIGRNVGVIDIAGAIIACSEPGRIGEVAVPSASGYFEKGGSFSHGNASYCIFGSDPHPEYASFVDGTDASAAEYAQILSVSLNGIRTAYDDKYDRMKFVKDILLGNVLIEDIYLKERELHLASDVFRAALLVRIPMGQDATMANAYDIIRSLFPDTQKDFIISVNSKDIVIVKEVSATTTTEDLENLARSISDALSSEAYIHSYIGIGTVVKDIKNVPESYQNAAMALNVGKVFDTERDIISYDNLGIARLISVLPPVLCNLFLKEVFKTGSIDSLDHETLFTIQKFFENNLNVSETSRKLFVHRNTLVYRLEKIKKMTGLDLREFDDAIVFKVALMVKKYLDAKPDDN